MKSSIEGLIYHFKIYTEGFAPPPGEVYQAIESPRGELGSSCRKRWSAKPYRVKFARHRSSTYKHCPNCAKAA